MAGGANQEKSHLGNLMSRHNPRLAKIHRTYTIEEIADLYNVHKNTVRHWIDQGLQVLDKKRPILIHGNDLSKFLYERRRKNKRTCKPGQLYCVKCREPRFPVGMEVDYQCLSDTQGNLIGLCSYCENLIYRRVSLVKLDTARGELCITMPQG